MEHGPTWITLQVTAGFSGCLRAPGLEQRTGLRRSTAVPSRVFPRAEWSAQVLRICLGVSQDILSNRRKMFLHWNFQVMFADNDKLSFKNNYDVKQIKTSLPYAFECSYVGCIYVYNVYVVLMDSSLKYYEMLFCVSLLPLFGSLFCLI